MAKAEIVVDKTFSFKDGKYVAQVKVFKVSRNLKFPDGFKVRCILVDQNKGVPLLLLDNHEPFGYHIHTRLPEDKDFRISVDVKNYTEAVQMFLKQAKRLVNHEN